MGRVHYKEYFDFIVHSASALIVNKTRTKQSLTQLIYGLSYRKDLFNEKDNYKSRIKVS